MYVSHKYLTFTQLIKIDSLSLVTWYATSSKGLSAGKIGRGKVRCMVINDS
jgi:hypothetical protein